MPVAKKTIYLNPDGKPVAEDADDAATLLVREGTYISEADAKQYRVSTDEAPVYDAVADHAARHGGETDAQARAARERMLEGQPDPDGPAVEGERGDVKATTPTATKAVTKAPENKGA